MIMNIFSTREIATGIWLGLFVLCFVFNKITRNSLGDLLHTVLSKKIIVPFIFIVLYLCSITFIFSKSPIWDKILLKDIIIWGLFIGIPACYSSILEDTSKKYFRTLIFNNLKLLVVVEFLINFYTFDIWVEIILVLPLTLLLIFDTVSERKKGYKSIHIITSTILTLLGFSLLGYTIYNAINNFSEIWNINVLISFIIPIVYSILFLPFIYLFSLCCKYESVFARMILADNADKKILKKHKRRVILTCGFSLKKIEYFGIECKPNFYKIKGDEYFNNILNSVKTHKYNSRDT